MRLSLTFPEPWVMKDARGDRLIGVLPPTDGETGPGAVVAAGPMGDRPDELGPWIAANVRADLPAGASLAAGPPARRQTAAGWPYHIVGAEVRNAQGQPTEARLIAFFQFLDHGAVALVRSPDRARLTRNMDVILAVLDSGRPDWRGAPIALAQTWDLPSSDPAALREVDARYDLAQACFQRGDFAAALAGFRAAAELAPDDLMPARKVIQCLYALDRVGEGEAARRELRDRWAASTDARVRMVDEYVFDQFAGEGQRVHALETLRPESPALHTLLAFRAVDEAGAPLPAAVLVETSDRARQAGAPFVIAVQRGARFEVVATLGELPPYAELKQTVVRLLAAPPSP